MSFYDTLEGWEKRNAERRAKQSFLQNLVEDCLNKFQHFKRHLSDIYYGIRDFIHIHLRGYADYEVYEYASNNSKRAVILLSKLKESKWLGHPGNWGCKECLNYSIVRPSDWECECKPFDRWRDAIDDMIFYHKCVSGQYEELDESSGHMIAREDPRVMDNVESQKRFRKGRWLYFSHYQALWD